MHGAAQGVGVVYLAVLISRKGEKYGNWNRLGLEVQIHVGYKAMLLRVHGYLKEEVQFVTRDG